MSEVLSPVSTLTPLIHPDAIMSMKASHGLETVAEPLLLDCKTEEELELAHAEKLP